MTARDSPAFAALCRLNRRVSRSIVYADGAQRVTLTAFAFRQLGVRARLSVGGILMTADGKFLVCHRRRSFLFTEIRHSRNLFRRQRLFRLHSRYLGAGERRRLSAELAMPSEHENDHVDLIFPGGTPRAHEGALECLLREIKEETNIDREHVRIDERVFLHAHIVDLLIDKQFDTVLFLGAVRRTCEQIRAGFVANAEVDALSFVDADNSQDAVACKIVRHAAACAPRALAAA
ncbi:MutT family NTP phosphohydrolase [Equine molluscum contagiosum-like virus]|nr:MutT family NTP phosphohydrolase [Equine molluscum contagiosum-like virus]